MSQYARNTPKQADFYRLLRISVSATTTEIKKAYRQLALELHPDRNGGSTAKIEEFKKVNEAYSVLTDSNKRREYDNFHFYQYGSAAGYTGDYNSKKQQQKHKSGFNHNYRKVYAPFPPPKEWNGKTWNHDIHEKYHYGDGFQQDIIEALRKEMIRDLKANKGKHAYKSPLGQGFSFNFDQAESNKNPYARGPQGPPKITVDYEEVDLNWRDFATSNFKAKTKEQQIIIEKLHIKRDERKREERLQRNMRPRTPPPKNRYYEHASNMNDPGSHVHARYYNNSSRPTSPQQPKTDDCVIL